MSTPEVTKSDLFHRAADLLEEFGWCQWAPARDEDDWSCRPTDPGAVRFCLTGAVERAIYDLCGGWEFRDQGPPPQFPNLKARRPGTGDPSPFDPVWNNADGRTRTEVVARLRELAEAAKDRERVVAS